MAASTEPATPTTPQKQGSKKGDWVKRQIPFMKKSHTTSDTASGNSSGTSTPPAAAPESTREPATAPEAAVSPSKIKLGRAAIEVLDSTEAQPPEAVMLAAEPEALPTQAEAAESEAAKEAKAQEAKAQEAKAQEAKAQEAKAPEAKVPEAKAQAAAAEAEAKAQAAAAEAKAKAAEAEARAQAAAAEAKARAQAAAAEAEAKAAAEAAEAEAKARAAEAARLAKLSEEELLAMQLEAHLSVDASAARGRLETAAAALGATEEALAAAREAQQKKSAEGARLIAGLEAQASAVGAVLRTVEPFEESCVALKEEVRSLAEMEERRRLDTQSIAGRAHKELAEAEKRLRVQEELFKGLQKAVGKAKSDWSSRKAKMVAEIKALQSDVASRDLKARLAKQHLDMLVIEQAKLTDQLEAVPRHLADKVARVEATKEEVEQLVRANLADEMTLVQRKSQEREIEESEAFALAAAQARARAYSIDRHCVASIATLQDTALASDLSSPSPTLADLAAGVETPSATPTAALSTGEADARALLQEARVLLLAHRETTARLFDQRDGAEKAEAQAVEQASEERAASLRQVRADRKAVEVALVERQRYLAEKAAQLDAEGRLVDFAEGERNDLQVCLKMVHEQVEKAKGVLAGREGEMHTARAAKAKAVAALEQQSLAEAVAIGQKQNLADSERRVKSEQASYVDALRARLKVEAQRIDEESAMESASRTKETPMEGAPKGVPEGAPEGAPDGADGQEAAAAAAVARLAEAPPGRAGLLLAQQSSMAEFIASLKVRRDGLQADLETATVDAAVAAQKAADEDLRLVDQHANQAHQVRKLSEYHQTLSKRLSGTGPDAGAMAAGVPSATTVATPGLATPTKAARSPPPPIALTSRSSSGAVLLPPVGSPQGRLDGTSDGKVAPVSPYPPRYIAAERFAPGTGDTEVDVDSMLGDESNHPRYNPDLPDPDQGALTAIRGRVGSTVLS